MNIPTRSPEQLGSALARFRFEKKISQALLATKAGIRQATVSKAETGGTTTQLNTIYALCAAMGLELVLRPRASSGALTLEDFEPS